MLILSTLRFYGGAYGRRCFDGCGDSHTVTLFIVGIIVIVMKGQISEKWSMSLEFLVGVMLVYLGIKTILSFKNSPVHTYVQGYS